MATSFFLSSYLGPWHTAHHVHVSLSLSPHSDCLLHSIIVLALPPRPEFIVSHIDGDHLPGLLV